jgi:hypothetical protein
MGIKKFFERALIDHPRASCLKAYYALNGSFHTLSGHPGRGRPSTRRMNFMAASWRLRIRRVSRFRLPGHIPGRSTVWIKGANYYGFDSFKGLPAIEGTDEGQNQFFEGQFACSKDYVVRQLTEHGIDWSRAKLIEGFFNESLTEDLKKAHPFKHVSVALIDCDLYSSTKDVLTWLGSLMTEGSILLFDDWYSLDDADAGQQKAFREFLETNLQFRAEPFIKFSTDGTSFIMHRA